MTPMPTDLTIERRPESSPLDDIEVASLQRGEPQPEPSSERTAADFDRFCDVELELRVELGGTELPLAEVVALRNGSIVLLDQSPSDPVEVYANGQRIARGEVVVIDGAFHVRITELVG